MLTKKVIYSGHIQNTFSYTHYVLASS